MVRFTKQLQSKAPEVQKESRAEEGYSTNEESDLVLQDIYLFLTLALTVLLIPIQSLNMSRFRVPGVLKTQAI